MTLSTSLVAVWYSSDSCGRGAGLQFVDQPRILDRDHRLVGEGADQLDLPLGERLDAQSGQRDHADRLAVAQQRCSHRRADSVDLGLLEPIVRIGLTSVM